VSKKSFQLSGLKGEGPVFGTDPNSEGFPASPESGTLAADPDADISNPVVGNGGGKLLIASELYLVTLSLVSSAASRGASTAE
jgi:hypothetical protein